MTRNLKGRTLLETQSAILDLIRTRGSVSRVDLAHESGLTEATISKVVKTLLERGWIIENGAAKSTGGKPPMMLGLNAEALFAIGMSLDPHKVFYVMSDLMGNPFTTMAAAGIGTLSPEAFIARVADDLRLFIGSSGVPAERIIGVGIANPGEIDSLEGRVSWSSTMDPEYFEIIDSIGRASGLPVVIENDAGCVALGEFWSTRMTREEDFVTLYLASGVGFALVIDGALYRGATSNVGGFQHVLAVPGGEECWCGARGCLRTVSSPVAVVETARRDPALLALLGEGSDDIPLDAVGGSDLYIGFHTLIDAADAGDVAATAVVDSSARYLADAIRGLVNVLDLDKVVLAGPGFDIAGERYRSMIADVLDTEALMRKHHPLTVELRRGGEEIAALGAAAVVFHKLLTPHHDPRG